MLTSLLKYVLEVFHIYYALYFPHILLVSIVIPEYVFCKKIYFYEVCKQTRL